MLLFLDRYATLWKLTKLDQKIFAADSTLCQLVKHGASTRRLWMGERFHGIEKIVIPMNITGHHWTLLVSRGCYSYCTFFFIK